MALATEAIAPPVFEVGKVSVKVIKIERNNSKKEPCPPKPVLIVTPTDAGEYPVILFLHGFSLQNRDYCQLLSLIASHGYIAVAPQFNGFAADKDINSAAAVANWLPDGLESELHTGVKANLYKLALAGHSKGGHTAFALALGRAKTALKLKFSVLIGIDPVAGRCILPALICKPIIQIQPKILSGPFNLGIPVLVVGTGLGKKKKFQIMCPCAPEEVSHVKFYEQCQPPCYHMVVEKYGHLDMLDDDADKLAMFVCESGDNDRDLMRRSIGGIVIAFLKAYLEDDKTDLQAIVAHPEIAPADLSDISYDEK